MWLSEREGAWERANDEQRKRYMALAVAAIEALGLTEEVSYRHVCDRPGKTAADCDVPQRRLVGPWVVGHPTQPEER